MEKRLGQRANLPPRWPQKEKIVELTPEEASKAADAALLGFSLENTVASTPQRRPKMNVLGFKDG